MTVSCRHGGDENSRICSFATIGIFGAAQDQPILGLYGVARLIVIAQWHVPTLLAGIMSSSSEVPTIINQPGVYRVQIRQTPSMLAPSMYAFYACLLQPTLRRLCFPKAYKSLCTALKAMRDSSITQPATNGSQKTAYTKKHPPGYSI